MKDYNPLRRSFLDKPVALINKSIKGRTMNKEQIKAEFNRIYYADLTRVIVENDGFNAVKANKVFKFLLDHRLNIESIYKELENE